MSNYVNIQNKIKKSENNKQNKINFNQLEQDLSTWVEIDLKALQHNLESYKKVVNKALLAPVIKSNAYGHSIEIIGKFLDDNINTAAICVASLSEAVYLRTKHIKKNIIVLSILDRDLEQAIIYDIQLVIYDLDTVLKLNSIAKKFNKKVDIHVKVDTGLSRLGINHDLALYFIEQVVNLEFINIAGIFSHFADSERNNNFANMQIDRFNNLISELEKKNIFINFKHMACSAPSTALKRSHYNLIRLGIGLYGLWPSTENKVLTKEFSPNFNLKPVLTWKTKIIQIKNIVAGSSIGYDRTFKAEKDMQLATLPIGYWDGYDRRLSNKGHVLINNQLVPVVGRVAMNLTTIDVTNLNLKINQEVTLLGDYPGITAQDLATACQTINYEFVTRINPLIPRIIKSDI